MAQYKIKLIGDGKCWVFAGKKPLQVKLIRTKGKVLVKCPCEKYKLVGDCEHCKSVSEHVPVVKFIVPEMPELETIEYIDGNIKKQLVGLLKSIQY